METPKVILPFGGLATAMLSVAATAIDDNATRPYAPVNVLNIGPSAEHPDNVIPASILRDICSFDDPKYPQGYCWMRGEGEQAKANSLFQFVPTNIIFSYGNLRSSDVESVLAALDGGDGTTKNSTVEVYGYCVDEMATEATKNARQGRMVVFDWRRQMARNQQNRDDADKRTEFELVDRIGVGYVPGDREGSTVTHPKQARMKSALHSLGISLSAGLVESDSREAIMDYFKGHWEYTTVSQAVQNLEPETSGETKPATLADAAAASVANAASEAPPVPEEELSAV